jgi:zinc protease
MKARGVLAGPVMLLCAVLFVTCASSGAVYQGLGAPDDALPFWEAVRTGRLESGLRYFILENAKPENRARLTLAVKAGSVNEKDDERGLAHFVEHMAFNGTERFPELQLLEYLRSLGMRFGADANAYTSYDETVYSIETPVVVDADGNGKKTIPEKALAIIDDWSRAVLFTEKDVDEERGVIMEEYRARLGAQDRVQQQIQSVLFRDSPYEHRRPIGLPEIIENAQASRLKAFYDTWYRPENMAVIIVGDFDGEALEQSLAAHFAGGRGDSGNGEGGGFSKPPAYELAPPLKGRFEAAVITDEEYGPANVWVSVKRDRKEKAATLAAFREELTEMLAFQMLNTRFSEINDDPAAPFTGAGSGTARYGASSRFAVFSGTAKQGRVRETLRAILTEKERAARYGFTASEIERAKTGLIGYLEQSVAEKDKIESAVFASEIVSYYVDGGYLAGIEWEAEAARALLPGITARDLQKAFQAMLAFDDTTVLIIANEGERASLPDEKEIAAIAAETRTARVSRPVNRNQTGTLLAATPHPGAIIAEDYDAAAGAFRLELSNGAQVILKPTANKNDEVVLSAIARGGYSGFDEAALIPARLAADMAEVSGAGQYSASDLAKLLTGKNVSVWFSVGPFTRSITGYTSGKDVKTFFELLHLAWKEPRFDEKAIGAYLDRQKTYIAQSKDNPDTYFRNELVRAVYTGNPAFMPFEEENIADLSADVRNAAALAREVTRAFRNPADWTFVFTGNIDRASFDGHLETYLASITSDAEHMNEYAGVTVTRPRPGRQTIRKGKENRGTVYAGYFAHVPFALKDALAAYTLNEYLDIHLNNLIREQRGGVYSIDISTNLSPLPPPGELTLEVSFHCDPSRADELQTAIHTEIENIARGVIATDVFAEAQEAQVKAWETGMQENGYIASRYANYAVISAMPLSRLQERGQMLRSVTPDDIQAIARKAIDAGAFVLVMEPEQK